MKRILFWTCALFALLIVALMLAGCRSSRQTTTPPPDPIELHDSDSVRVETRIETVYVPVRVEVPVPQQSQANATPSDSSHVETDVAASDAWFLDGILHHTIYNKPGVLTGETYVPQTNKQTDSDRIKIKEIPVPKPYPVEVERELTRWQRLRLDSWPWMAAALAMCVGWMFRKPIANLIIRK